jgi:hypothetical protein
MPRGPKGEKRPAITQIARRMKPTETGLTSGRLKEFPSWCVNYDT